MNTPKEEIRAAAILQEGHIYTLSPPARHPDIIHWMTHVLEVVPPVCGEQGFYTTRSRFVDRKDAAQLAREAGQLKSALIAPPHLYSEDLW